MDVNVYEFKKCPHCNHDLGAHYRLINKLYLQLDMAQSQIQAWKDACNKMMNKLEEFNREINQQEAPRISFFKWW